MTPLRLQSEEYRPEGGIDARSQRRTLGKPALEFPDLFLRETLQNSWDARTTANSIRFHVDAWQTTTLQHQVLRDIIFHSLPAQGGPADHLAEPPRVLVISDTGTRGLNGPTRADAALIDGSNFVDLIRNTGRDVAKGFGGGTYGFGKAVLFEASKCATIVVFSRSHDAGTQVNRLIAMTLAEPFARDGKRYTGRHWWGASGRGIVEPLEGEEAGELAQQLGLTRVGRGTTGTAIMVIAPETGAYGLDGYVDRLAAAATEHAWPHMVAPVDGRPDIAFRFTCNDRVVTPPDPATDPRLRHFVAALARCESLDLDLDLEHADAVHAWPWTVEQITSRRPERTLGVLAHREYSYTASGAHDAAPAEIALMRAPRFVVQYLPVRPAASGQATAGVFIAAPELDIELAKSEPASHDDWRPENLQLEAYARNPVRQTLDQIKNRFKARTSALGATSSSHHAGTVALASQLGRLLDGTVTGNDPRLPATSPGRSAGPTTKTDARTTPSDPHDGTRYADGDPGQASRSEAGAAPVHPTPARSTGRARGLIGPNTRITTVDGHIAVEFEVEITMPIGAPETIATVEPYVIVDGGRESEPPTAASIPRVISWSDRLTGRVTQGSTLGVTAVGTHRWTVTVTQPADTAVSIRLDLARALP